MLELNRTKCCGLRELHGIQDDHDLNHTTPHIIIQFVKRMMMMGNKRGAFVTFASADQGWDGHYDTAGKNLAKHIRLFKLGSLSGLKTVVNPNSGNPLSVWLWQVDYKELCAYTGKEPVQKAVKKPPAKKPARK